MVEQLELPYGLRGTLHVQYCNTIPLTQAQVRILTVLYELACMQAACCMLVLWSPEQGCGWTHELLAATTVTGRL